MRILTFLLSALPLPAAAWVFEPLPICTLAQDQGAAQVVITYDPAGGVYTLTMTLAQGTWPLASAFHIAFDGPRALTIGTDRHALSEDARTLTVRDTGFGNVLDGLEYGTRAMAFTGNLSVPIALNGAAPQVAAFRRCGNAPPLA